VLARPDPSSRTPPDAPPGPQHPLWVATRRGAGRRGERPGLRPEGEATPEPREELCLRRGSLLLHAPCQPKPCARRGRASPEGTFLSPSPSTRYATSRGGGLRHDRSLSPVKYSHQVSTGRDRRGRWMPRTWRRGWRSPPPRQARPPHVLLLHQQAHLPLRAPPQGPLRPRRDQRRGLRPAVSRPPARGRLPADQAGQRGRLRPRHQRRRPPLRLPRRPLPRIIHTQWRNRCSRAV